MYAPPVNHSAPLPLVGVRRFIAFLPQSRAWIFPLPANRGWRGNSSRPLTIRCATGLFVSIRPEGPEESPREANGLPRPDSLTRHCCAIQPLELLRLDDPRMLAVGQDASRRLLEAEREFLGRSVVPAPDAPGADEISITELDLAPLQRWAPILVNTAKLLEQAINDVYLQWAQDGAAVLADDGGGIEMTYGEIVQHHRSLSAIARRMRLAPSVIRSSVSACSPTLDLRVGHALPLVVFMGDHGVAPFAQACFPPNR